MGIKVSVVVPTFKRHELLNRCLASLGVQDFDPAAYEIIVADDAACPETRALVEGWRQRSAAPVRYIPVHGAHGPAAARNCGWQTARGDIIAFTDDDCIPDPEWLKAGIAVFVDGVTAAAGRVVVPLPPHPTDYERNAAGLAKSEFVTANCFYRRDAIAELGGFDEQFQVAWREDSDLLFRLLEREERVVEVPDAVVTHPVRPARWGVSLSQQRKSEFDALLYKKHPRLYRERVYPARVGSYYAAAGALFAGLLGLIVGKRGMGLAALGAWALWTAGFCAKRIDGTSRDRKHVVEMAITSALIPPLSIYWRLRGAVKYRVWFW